MTISLAITFIIAIALIFEGIYALVKGTFYERRNKPANHDPNAYRTWVRISGVFSLIAGILLPIWDILEIMNPAFSDKSITFSLVTLIGMIVIYAITYLVIVKPADKKAGIVSDFTKAIEEAEQKEAEKKARK